jgi:hypothetical protein
MSFWKKLFGGGGSAAPAEISSDPEEYNGFTIRATPFSEGGQYQTCGVITKSIDGEVKEHRFIRADRFPSKDDAIDVSLRKARQIIDQQGDQIFR